MKTDFDTLSTVLDSLTRLGFTEDFKAEEKSIVGLYNKKSYQPHDLKIVKSYRFDGMTNPEDESELLAVIANDGIKGTLVMSYSAEHNQNVDLIRQIEMAKKEEKL